MVPHYSKSDLPLVVSRFFYYLKNANFAQCSSLITIIFTFLILLDFSLMKVEYQQNGNTDDLLTGSLSSEFNEKCKCCNHIHKLES